MLITLAEMKFDHVGLVVADLATGRDHLSALFGIEAWTQSYSDPVNHVHVQFGRDASAICYELIAPLDDKSPVAKTLVSGRNILNHMAYLVPDLAIARERLLSNGCVAVGPANPAIAYGGRSIQFFLSRLRFIIELIEAHDHRHIYAHQRF